jgi:hypothetical protein
MDCIYFTIQKSGRIILPLPLDLTLNTERIKKALLAGGQKYYSETT